MKRRITSYSVDMVDDPEWPEASIWSVSVAWRGPDSWGVYNGSRALSRSGTWDYEPLPSSREDDWLTEHRFTREEALRRAEMAAPDIVWNGYTAHAAYDHWKAGPA